jgi:hypothetical protein
MKVTYLHSKHCYSVISKLQKQFNFFNDFIYFCACETLNKVTCSRIKTAHTTSQYITKPSNDKTTPSTGTWRLPLVCHRIFQVVRLQLLQTETKPFTNQVRVNSNKTSGWRKWERLIQPQSLKSIMVRINDTLFITELMDRLHRRQNIIDWPWKCIITSKRLDSRPVFP